MLYDSLVQNILASLFTITVAVILVGYISVFRRSRPPGPHGLPIVGNIFQFPREKEWLTYAKWAEKYGKIMSLRAFSKTIVIVNDFDTAAALLDQRSAIYSDRPVLPMLTEHMGWNNTLGLSPYGDRFRRYRRLLHHFMGTRAAVEKYADLLNREAQVFLRHVVERPSDVQEHIRRHAGAVILMMTYGYPIKDGNDPYIDVVNKATKQFAQASLPGAFLVDTLPILQYLPEWLPGNNWKKKATEWRRTLFEMADWPFNQSKERMAQGCAVPSYTTNLLQSSTELDEEDENAIKWSAASLYGGGADTSVSAVYAFFLAMALYPDIQCRAQAEIDAVVGGDRLPALSDRGSLPYIEAIVFELLRWQPITPLNVPHACSEDNMFEDYFIPKGSIIMVNSWLLLHDPSVYKEPHEFNPGRFMTTKSRSAERDPHEIVFGFGRRTCPGRHVADASIFMSVASILATLEVRKVVENGKVIDPVIEPSSGGISHPMPFKCNIVPRSARLKQLIYNDPANI